MEYLIIFSFVLLVLKVWMCGKSSESLLTDEPEWIILDEEGKVKGVF